MKCPNCGNEMKAVGGVPTVWECPSCTRANVLKHSNKPEVRFVGDTHAVLRRLEV